MSTRRTASLSGRLPLFFYFLSGFAAVFLTSISLRATTVIECDLLELYRRAGTIFHGRCLSKKEVLDGEPVPYTKYTFLVLEAVKGLKDAQGKTPKSITSRHAGVETALRRPDGLESPPFRLGVPEYAVGEEVVLFLTEESSVGLCAPVGLSQGKFRVTKKDGGTFVKNRHGNRRLFEKLDRASFLGLEEGELEAARAAPDKIELGSFLKLLKNVKP